MQGHVVLEPQQHNRLSSGAPSATAPVSPGRSRGEIRHSQQQHHHHLLHNGVDLPGSALETYGPSATVSFESTENALDRSTAHHADGGFLGVGTGNSSLRGEEINFDDILESDWSWVTQDWNSGYF